MLKIVFTLVFLESCFALLFIPKTDYCNIDVCSKGPHIACAHYLGYGVNCTKNARVIDLSSMSVTGLTERVNSLRNLVASGEFKHFPAATRMLTITWDYELAFLAELNVRQCVMHHDGCRNTIKFKQSGQSLAYKAYVGKIPAFDEILESQIDMWFKEHEDVTPDIIEKYHVPDVEKPNANFAQIMRDDLIAFGCAILVQYQSGWLQQFMTCNFATMNFIGFPIYKTGKKSGTDCETGRNPKFKNLCSLSESSIELNTVSTSTQPPVRRTKHQNSSTPFDDFLNKVSSKINKVGHINLSVNTNNTEIVNENRVRFRKKPKS